jgi:hypothetical protein
MMRVREHVKLFRCLASVRNSDLLPSTRTGVKHDDLMTGSYRPISDYRELSLLHE